MGKKTKEHRKKVKARNTKIRQEEREVEKLRKLIYEEAKQRYMEGLSAKTENTFQIKL